MHALIARIKPCDHETNTSLSHLWSALCLEADALGRFKRGSSEEREHLSGKGKSKGEGVFGKLKKKITGQLSESEMDERDRRVKEKYERKQRKEAGERELYDRMKYGSKDYDLPYVRIDGEWA